MANYTILIIDYEPRSIKRTRTALEYAGFTVEVANDGIAGLRAFENLEPDLVLVEAMIPKKHGFEVCAEIKKGPRGKQVPVAIMTAVYKGRKYRTQAIHLHGCDEYIEKPVEDEKLVELCRSLLKAGDPPGEPEQPADTTASEQAPEGKEPVERKPLPDLDGAEDEIAACLDAIMPNDEDGEEDAGADVEALAPAPVKRADAEL